MRKERSDFSNWIIIEGIISKPSFREYVLYSDCKDLTTNDRVLPTRQYAIVKDNEIRILDMQTTDALYSWKINN